MVAVLLVSALFVSCKQEIATPQDRLGSVRISLPSSRDLTPGTPTSIIPTVTNWYYVATKAAGDYYRTGEESWGDLAAMASGQEVGTTGFSAGEWTFSFYGFATEAAEGEKANAIYKAEGIQKTVIAGDTPNYIDVTLQIGNINFGKVYFQNLTFNGSAIPSGLTLKINNTVVSSLPHGITISAEGDFPCTVELYSGEQLVGSAATSITVSKGYNYYIEGDINQLDQLGFVVIQKVEYQKSAADTQTVVSNADTTFKTPVSPEGSETTVTFGAGVLSEGSKTLTTTVTGSESAGAFVITAGSSVASIDLSLDGASSSEFSEAVTVTTYVARGLTQSSVQVVYNNGSGVQPSDISYDPATGLLSFKTTHFSQFVVVSSDQIIVSDGTAYATLAAFRDAVNAGNSFAGKTVYLMKDVTLSGEWEPIGRGARYQENPVVFSGTFDGKGHTISGLTTSGYEPTSYVADHSEYTAGLFGYVKNGTVRNVRLSGVSVTQSTTDTYPLENAGAVVGFLENGTVENCEVLSGTVSGYNGIGGVVGRAYGTCTIQNCVNGATISGKKNVAGVVGFVNPQHNGTIKVLANSNNGSVTRTAATGKEGAGAAAGVVCYGCSDNVAGASGSVYIQGNTTSTAQIIDEGGSRAAAIHFLTSHGINTTSGTVDVQEQGILGTAENPTGFPTEDSPIPL